MTVFVSWIPVPLISILKARTGPEALGDLLTHESFTVVFAAVSALEQLGPYIR